MRDDRRHRYCLRPNHLLEVGAPVNQKVFAQRKRTILLSFNWQTKVAGRSDAELARMPAFPIRRGRCFAMRLGLGVGEYRGCATTSVAKENGRPAWHLRVGFLPRRTFFFIELPRPRSPSFTRSTLPSGVIIRGRSAARHRNLLKAIPRVLVR